VPHWHISQHGETVSVFCFSDVRTSEMKTAVKQCCRWPALLHATAHSWNSLKQF